MANVTSIHKCNVRTNNLVVDKWTNAMIKVRLAEIIYKALKHVDILSITRCERFDQANNPESEREDEGANGQDQATWQPQQSGFCAITCFRHLLIPQFVNRLDPDDSHLSWSLKHLSGGVKNHFQERYSHCEQHPDVDHLDIRRNSQTLGKSQKTKTNITLSST